MIFKYDVLSKVIKEDKTIKINENSYITKIKGLNGIDYSVSDHNRHDYYVFLPLNDDEGVVISTDNHTGLGFELLRIPKREFCLGINTNNNFVDYYDGPGTQTDFPDVIEQEELDQKYIQYNDASDEELKETKLYQQVDTCVSKYLRVSSGLEEALNLAIIRLAFLAHTVNQRAVA
ncbi:hypothetical protein ACSAHR_07555 [Pediococcus pentosaceus]|uniref:hypothetical protein n=1 Tax=Pediococcus pentosaceus TaxID=1255 RepID=UPI0040394C99